MKKMDTQTIKNNSKKNNSILLGDILLKVILFTFWVGIAYFWLWSDIRKSITALMILAVFILIERDIKKGVQDGLSK
jgi:hypothetical protein